MKAAKLVIVLVIVLALMNWSRGTNTFALPMTLPLLGGEKPGIFDWAGLIAVGIGIANLIRLARNRNGNDHNT